MTARRLSGAAFLIGALVCAFAVWVCATGVLATFDRPYASFAPTVLGLVFLWTFVALLLEGVGRLMDP